MHYYLLNGSNIKNRIGLHHTGFGSALVLDIIIQPGLQNLINLRRLLQLHPMRRVNRLIRQILHNLPLNLCHLRRRARRENSIMLGIDVQDRKLQNAWQPDYRSAAGQEV